MRRSSTVNSRSPKQRAVAAIRRSAGSLGKAGPQPRAVGRHRPGQRQDLEGRAAIGIREAVIEGAPQDWAPSLVQGGDLPEGDGADTDPGAALFRRVEQPSIGPGAASDQR